MCNTNFIYRELTQAALDAAYDQRNWATDLDGTLLEYQRRSDAFAKQLAPRALQYGPTCDEWLDLYHPNPTSPLPLCVFVHGGAWLRGTKSLYGFAASHACKAGQCCAVLDFSPADRVGLREMVRQVGRAISFLVSNAGSLRIASDGMSLIGHSSGAHLAACIIAGSEGCPKKYPFRSAYLISGIYDLEPVMLSARRSYLGLKAAEVNQINPIAHAKRIAANVRIFTGEIESPEFHRQADAFSDALTQQHKQHSRMTVPGRDHFTVLLDLLGDTRSSLMRWTQSALPPTVTA